MKLYVGGQLATFTIYQECKMSSEQKGEQNNTLTKEEQREFDMLLCEAALLSFATVSSLTGRNYDKEKRELTKLFEKKRGAK